MELIDGIATKSLKVIPDERGRLMEMLRADDEIFHKFGQVYMSTTYPGVVKGWHSHNLQADNIVCVFGMIKLVVHDSREDSPTRGMVNEFFIGEHNPTLVHVPPKLNHGWKCLSTKEALIINIPTEVYNYESPDEHRSDPHDNDIPYDWSRSDG